MKFNANTIGAIVYPTIFFAVVLTIFVILPLTAKAEIQRAERESRNQTNGKQIFLR